MVTISPERPTIVLVQAPTAAPLPVMGVRDADGRLLVSVEMAEPLEGNEVQLGEVDDQSLLMAYYFGRGGREVLLTLASSAIHARLDTRWAGDHRAWWLDLHD